MKILTTFVMTSAFAIGGFGALKMQPIFTKKTIHTGLIKPEKPIIEPSLDGATAAEPQQFTMPASIGAGAIPAPAVIEPTELDAPSVVADSTVEPPAVNFEAIELITGAQQGVIQATITGNARETAVAHLRNNSPTPYRVQIPIGQVLESGRNTVVVLRSETVELLPAGKADVSLRTAALHSANKVGEATFRLSYQAVTKVQLFLTWLADHPEVTVPAAQTAILALTENLPVNALSKFAPANGLKSSFNTDAFRVETPDLIGALCALRDSGVGMGNVALTMDPQLRIEAMIEPLSREVAKRYYGIAESAEWEFWKHELLQGDPSTRHYALFGIARFYPDVALEMLPRWAREAKTHPVYRMSAVQAIADTQRPEALPILRQLAEEIGEGTDLGKAAAQAAAFLDRRLTQLAQNSPIIAFRGKDGVSGL